MRHPNASSEIRCPSTRGLSARTPRPIGIPLRASLGTLGIALAVGCGSPGSLDQPLSPPLPPTGLTVVQDQGSFDRLILTWSPPSTTFEGYEGQGRLDGGAWEGFGQLLPAQAIGATLTLDTVPELVELGFRLRSIRGQAASSWTDEARFTRGLRWPQSISASPRPAGMALAWANASAKATGFRVSRMMGSAWVVLADLPGTVTSYLDTVPMAAGEPIGYRIDATRASVASAGPPFYSPGYPPTPVGDLVASSSPAGVHLQWTLPPISDQSVAVRRCSLTMVCPPVDPVPLPPGTRQFLDPAPPGAWTYVVESRFGTPAASGAQATVEAAAVPLGGPALTATLARMPYASSAAHHSTGLLAFALGASYYPPATATLSIAFRGPGAPPDHDLGAGHGWVEPSVRFDPSGNLHAMVLRPAPLDPALSAVVHAWNDGTGWREEEVVRRAFDDPTTLRFAVDAAGGLHLAWTARGGSVAGYARRGAGGWEVDDLAATLGPSATLQALAVDGTGVPALLATVPAGNLVTRRTAGWVADAPVEGFAASLHPTTAGLALVRVRCTGDVTARRAEVLLRERGGPGWGADAVLEEWPQCLPVDYLGYLEAPGGGRATLWTGPMRRLRLSFREGAGAWTPIETGLSSPPSVWFDEAGKLGLLVPGGGYPALDGFVTWVAYAEP